jgi:hypothetical protein
VVSERQNKKNHRMTIPVKLGSNKKTEIWRDYNDDDWCQVMTIAHMARVKNSIDSNAILDFSSILKTNIWSNILTRFI